MPYTDQDRADLQTKLEPLFPFVSVSRSTLGDEARASLHIHLSLQAKAEWGHNIFHNSRYLIAHVWEGGVLEHGSGCYKNTAKIRKARNLTLDDVVAKLAKWRDAERAAQWHEINDEACRAR